MTTVRSTKMKGNLTRTIFTSLTFTGGRDIKTGRAVIPRNLRRKRPLNLNYVMGQKEGRQGRVLRVSGIMTVNPRHTPRLTVNHLQPGNFNNRAGNIMIKSVIINNHVLVSLVTVITRRAFLHHAKFIFTPPGLMNIIGA